MLDKIRKKYCEKIHNFISIKFFQNRTNQRRVLLGTSGTKTAESLFPPYRHQKADIKMSEPEAEMPESETQLEDTQQNGEGVEIKDEAMESQDGADQGGGDASGDHKIDEDEDER